MRVSLNELETRYGRAFEGMGTPAGLAQDAARMVARHDVWGLGGLAALVARLDRLDGDPPRSPRIDRRKGRVVLAAGGASLLHVGPQALDLLEVACASTGGGIVAVEDCADADFLPGLAALTAERDLTACARTRLDGTVLAAAVCGGELALHWAPANSVSAPGAGSVELVGGNALPASLPEAAHAERQLDPHQLAALEAEAVDQGVAVDEADWRRVYELGARFLVSESEASRARGAGGGSDVE